MSVSLELRLLGLLDTLLEEWRLLRLTKRLPSLFKPFQMIAQTKKLRTSNSHVN